jgi:hypothetical protein
MTLSGSPPERILLKEQFMAATRSWSREYIKTHPE